MYQYLANKRRKKKQPQSVPEWQRYIEHLRQISEHLQKTAWTLDDAQEFLGGKLSLSQPVGVQQ